eukprot:EG_transcript_7079
MAWWLWACLWLCTQAQGQTNGDLTISVMTMHDASLCLARGSDVLAVVPLEALCQFPSLNAMKQPSFRCTDWDPVHADSVPRNVSKAELWQKALAVAWASAGLPPPVEVVRWGLKAGDCPMPASSGLPPMARQWRPVDHHRSHAAHAYYSSPFQQALVLTLDGIGNDGSFLVWRGTRTGPLQRLTNIPISYGAWYRLFAERVFRSEYQRAVQASHNVANPCATLLMDLAPQGRVVAPWRAYVNRSLNVRNPVRKARLEAWVQRQVAAGRAADLAASVQAALEASVRQYAERYLQPEDEGVALGGGVALNGRLVTALAHYLARPVHVPAAPNDLGIALGAVWAATPPPLGAAPPLLRRGLGFAAPDLSALPVTARRHAAQRASAAAVAALLHRGATVAVMRGRFEVTARTDAGRCVVARWTPAPAARLLPAYRWRAFQSVPVLVLEERLVATVPDGARIKSPHMSHIFHLPESRNRSVLLQTVGPDDLTWLGGVVRRYYGRRPAPEPLLFFPFRGQTDTVVTHIAEALLQWQHNTYLDILVLEDWVLQVKAPGHAIR